MKTNYIRAFFILFSFGVIFSCKKQDEFLNKKSNLSDVVPTTIQDFQAVLDEDYTMNQFFPSIGQLGADNYYIFDSNYSVQDPVAQNAIVWKKDIFTTASNDGDWSWPYAMIERCNIVFDGLSKLSANRENQTQYNNVKGSAYFFRAFAYYLLAQNFCKPYDASTATIDLGLVLRSSSDVNVKPVRSTNEATYQQMILDAKQALTLLPVTPMYQTRPSVPACSALLAKIYLCMGDYKNALIYSTNSLNQFKTLLDFNTLNPSSSSPLPPFPKNTEVNFYAQEASYGHFVLRKGNFVSNVDTNLYHSYNDNDLRKTVFYNIRPDSTIQFKGTFTGTFYLFGGIATDEIYLINAECNARLGNLQAANNDLNTLLATRWKTGTFVPLSITDPDSLLKTIISERRKELPFTGEARWEDLRRLNKDPKFAITLTRTILGVTYTLPPNDPRYTYPIPPEEIQISGIQQNPR